MLDEEYIRQQALAKQQTQQLNMLVCEGEEMGGVKRVRSRRAPGNPEGGEEGNIPKKRGRKAKNAHSMNPDDLVATSGNVAEDTLSGRGAGYAAFASGKSVFPRRAECRPWHVRIADDGSGRVEWGR